jgi:hypothetical protein
VLNGTLKLFSDERVGKGGMENKIKALNYRGQTKSYNNL